jgi:hypothetical protein
MPRTLDITDIAETDRLAHQIANTFQSWESFRNKWLTEKQEIRDYIFATDTRGTTNASLPWKNSTHVPKLCQIRDNLHANYMAALFPNDRPVSWEGDDEDADAKETRLAIESYIENKMRMSKFRATVSQAVYDFIDYGNCFGMTEFVDESTTDPLTGEKIQGYVGPRLVRISPLDIVFNPAAASFDESPKIVRTIKTLGDLKADIDDHPESKYLSQAFEKALGLRHSFKGMSQGDQAKTHGYLVDGFSSLQHYLNSDYIELLDFYGDYYDQETGTFYKNQIITIVDRMFVIRNITNPSWFGKPNIFHVGWRLRPDNLYAMGPLDNLVGMQYRIDHLENAKADAFDLVVHPVTKITGFVEDFEYGPGERIFCGEEGDVEFMRADLSHILQADTQIAMYEQKMEEMAGAPKQAMGFRTPGEKTAYEVQILENGSNRIFINKTAYFEEMFLEPVLNSMLEIARRNMGPSDLIRVIDDQYGIASFMKITRDDITASGKIRPIGARRFARNANIVQNITQMMQTVGQDPSINVHISGRKLAGLFEQLLDLERYDLVQDNIRLYEQMQTAKLQQSAQQILQEQGGPPGATPMVQQPTQGSAGPVQATGAR